MTISSILARLIRVLNFHLFPSMRTQGIISPLTTTTLLPSSLPGEGQEDLALI